MSHEEEGMPIRWVVVLMSLVLIAFGWAFFAASYAHANQDWGSGTGRQALAAFIINAFQQLPNFFQVLDFVFTKRLWLVIVFAVLECLVLLAGFGMKQLEKSAPESPRSSL